MDTTCWQGGANLHPGVNLQFGAWDGQRYFIVALSEPSI